LLGAGSGRYHQGQIGHRRLTAELRVKGVITRIGLVTSADALPDVGILDAV